MAMLDRVPVLLLAGLLLTLAGCAATLANEESEYAASSFESAEDARRAVLTHWELAPGHSEDEAREWSKSIKGYLRTAKTEYRIVAEEGPSEWAAAALVRAGDMYWCYGEMVGRRPMPPGLRHAIATYFNGAEIRQAWKPHLRVLVEGNRRLAKRYWAAATELPATEGSRAWIELARNRLSVRPTCSRPSELEPASAPSD
jgi:hypothetical protein